MNFFKKYFTSFSISFLVIALILYYYGFFGNHLHISRSDFQNLPGWEQDDHARALNAFKRSCQKILVSAPKAQFGLIKQARKNEDWQKICEAAKKIADTDNDAAKKFFETWFLPYRVTNNFNSTGFFTGYYLPLLKASLSADHQYKIPIYALPRDLVKVDLGIFRSDLMGQTLVGQFKNNHLLPYPTRAEINRGAIRDKADVIAYALDEVDLFFAHIQGSAVIQLPDQKEFVISYAGKNGRSYIPIGRILIHMNAIKKEDISMQSIRAWLADHPDQIPAILNQNASYVFFRMIDGPDPIGTEEVPLIAWRSMAVDTRYIPLGAPLWLDTRIEEKGGTKEKFQHLLIAQDTGGAIKGIVRGDLYCGAGDDAAYVAGHLSSPGHYWILLPKQ